MQSHPSHHVSIVTSWKMQRPWVHNMRGFQPHLYVEVKQEQGPREVFMLHRVSDVSVAKSSCGEYRRLAQRLTDLRNQINHVQARMCGRRSEDERLPMQRPSCAAAAPEPACDLVMLHSARPAAELPVEKGMEGNYRHMGPHPTGVGRDRQEHTCQSSERAHGEWQVDGAQGSSASAWPDRDAGHQHEVCRLSGAHGIEMD